MARHLSYDTAIVGYGPAGITAAIYSARKKLKIILFGELPGGEVVNSGQIENWPGGGQTDGFTLAQSMVKHLDLHKDDVTIVRQKITQITKTSDGFELLADNREKYTSATVIYATGRYPRKLNIPGEDEFRNKGISYCATCDAPLFAGKSVAVIGGGNRGAEAVIMLQPIASRIYLLHLNNKLSADQVLVNNFINDPKVKIILNAKTTAVAGKTNVGSLTYENLTGAPKGGPTQTIKVDGIFVCIGAIPNSQPIKDLVQLNEQEAIITDKHCYTNIPGFFAAGDATDTRDAQIIVAAGQGCTAALSASDYLNRQNSQ